MKKQIADQVAFFLMGLQGRFEDNQEEITAIDVTFTSGLKQYTLKAKRNGEQLTFHFTGNSYTQTYAQFAQFLVARIGEFDSMELVMHERTRDTVITADERRAVTQSKAKTNEPEAGELRASSMSNRAYFIQPERAAALLKAIGMLGGNGKVRNDKIRKYNQIDHFIELMDPMLRKVCREKTVDGKKSVLNVVDCACGKSYLSFALNYYIREVLDHPCHFTGLDYNEIVIEDSKKIANELDYRNMQFVQTDIMQYVPDRHYDLMITLHACDTATDKALRFAINRGVKSVVCVPCCHKEMNKQGYTIDGLESVLRHGILNARIADSLTDGLRALYLEAMGYEVSMVEYISPLDTPKNLMMRCVKTRGYDGGKMAEFDALCARLGVSLSIAKD